MPSRDALQHAALVKLQGCPPSRALESYKRQQARQIASKSRAFHPSRQREPADPNEIVNKVSDKILLAEVLEAIDPQVAQVLTHRCLFQRSADDVTQDLGISKSTQTRILRNLTDVGYEWWDKVRKSRRHVPGLQR